MSARAGFFAVFAAINGAFAARDFVHNDLGWLSLLSAIAAVSCLVGLMVEVKS